jgi:hypothetical protein
MTYIFAPSQIPCRTLRLAGHKNRAMTEHYVKARETEEATPPSLPKKSAKVLDSN